MKALTQTSKKLALALVVSAAASQAGAVTMYLVSVEEYAVRSDNGAESTLAFDISGSTATWNFDGSTLSGVGLYDAELIIPPANTLQQHLISDLTIVMGGSTSAASFECVEGVFGSYVGANICAGTEFGSDHIDDSSIVYSGVDYVLTIGGDDVINSPAVQLSHYDYQSHIWDGSTLVLNTVFRVGGGADRQRVMTFSAVPVPAAAWLFGSAILGLAGFKSKRIKW